MSRVNSKSALSPSATRGSSAIDLGKDSGVNLGRKTQPSVTTGGIGVTQEVGNIGGMTVTGGVSVEISPIGINISGNPSNNTISISGSAELPGGLLGVSGGTTVDTSTGKIIGGSIGGEIGGLGINVSSQEGDVGIEFTYQIPFTPIELSIEFQFPKKKPLTTSPLPSFPQNFNPLNLPTSIYCQDGSFYYLEINGFPFAKGMQITKENWEFNTKNGGESGGWPYSPWNDEMADAYWGLGNWVMNTHHYLNWTWWHGTSTWRKNDGSSYGQWVALLQFEHEYEIYSTPGFYADNQIGKGGEMYNFKVTLLDIFPYPNCPRAESPPTENPSSPFVPFPNPPPRKRNMDECCRDSIKLLRKIKIYDEELLRLLGRQVGPKGLLPITGAVGFLGEKIKRIETPITDGKRPKEIEVSFPTVYQLLTYGLKQANDLDTALDPKSYKIPSGYIQNPKYSRDSEHSLKYNEQPNRDKFGEKREFEINEDSEAKMAGFLEQQKYVFNALKRLEYLFPYGELTDAQFAKNLIIPGAIGELKIHNLIHFQEFFTQYLNATLGDPKISIKVEDNNALKEGKQEGIFRHFSIAQMIRELYKITLESGDDINAIMETGVRNFRTNLANRIQIVQIAEMVQALVEDTGMLESQEFIPLKLEGDPYAGKWKAGMGFEADADLDSNEEAATERLMRATLKNFEAQVKVIRRDKRENSDIRDLLIQIAEMFIRSTSIPATKEGIEKALAAAKFKTQVDMALTRSQVKRAAAASRSRTKKRKKQ